MKLTVLRLMTAALLLFAAARAEDLPLLGLAHAGVRVTSLETARPFYEKVLGLEEAFRITGPGGAVTAAYFKVNDDEFLKLIPGLQSNDLVPMTHIAFRTSSAEKARRILLARGLSPSPVEVLPHGQGKSFRLGPLPGQKLEYLEFVEYTRDSQQRKARGKALGARRMAVELQHAGIVTIDMAAAREFYTKALGFRETWSRTNAGRVVLVHLRLPGKSGDYVEIVNRGGVALDREIAGEAGHFAFQVPDARATHQVGLERGQEYRRQEPRFGRDERWQCNLFDTDGTRVEFMQPRDPAKKTPVPPAVVP